MLIMVVVVVALGLLLFGLGDHKKPPTGLAFASPRSTRDLAIDEDMALVGEAYRESELIRMRKEAIAKVASLVETTGKSK